MAGAEGAPAPLSFSDFLDKMKDPAAADLVRPIKVFIRRFDERPSAHVADPAADSAAVQDFLARMEAAFPGHPAWRGAPPEVLDQAIEGLEKYVMSKIWPRTFSASAEDRDRDERYARLAAALSFVDLPTLLGEGMPAVAPDEALVTAAVGELLRMDRYKAPRDKLLCLVNVKTLVEDVVGAAVRGGAPIGGADAFFPVFLLVVIRARLPRLASNIEYVRRFRGRARLHGQFDYMLANLESAALYLDTADWRHLKVPQDEFLARLAAAGIPEADMELRALRAAGGAVASGEAADETAAPVRVVGEEAAAVPEPAVPAAVGAAVEGEQGEQPAPADADASAEGSAAPGMAASESVAALSEPVTEAADVSGAPLAAAAAQEAPPPPGPAADASTPLRVDIPAPEEAQPELSPLETPAPPADTPTFALPGALGLTPLGAGPQTPVLIKKRAPPEERPPTAAPTSADDLVAAMVADGTGLVLAEEAAGRLQRRHRWIYAAAEDLTPGDVRALLASYRDLVFKFEALTLSLQQQVGGSGGGAVAGAPVSPSQAGSQGTAVGASESLLQRLTSWGRPASERDGPEAAAALQGKAAAGGDHRLLTSLFGTPQGQAKGPAAAQADLLGDLGGDSGSAAAAGELDAVASPTLGLVESEAGETQ